MLTDIVWYKSVDSTNSEARRLVREIDNLSVIAAESQTAGRGQGDHKWHSRACENLTFSLLLKFPPISPLHVSDALLLTEFITHSLREFLLSFGITSRIKWPNDIYVGDLKICGILIENILQESQVAASIIGVGLNLNQTSFPADIPNPTSISLQTGKHYDVGKTLEQFCRQIEKSVQLLETEDGRKYLDEYFQKNMFRKQ